MGGTVGSALGSHSTTSSQSSGTMGEGNQQIKVMVVDDERMIRNLLTMSLRRMGYEVITAENGLIALEKFAEHDLSLIILDVMMPEMDGFSVCSEIRKESEIPIIILTALSRPEDTVLGLELGADNYITKPFTFKEVEARIRALLRRVSQSSESTGAHISEFGDLKLNYERQEVLLDDQTVPLTQTEFRLLDYLARHAGQPVSKGDLLKHVWGYEIIDNNNLVEIAVRRLRKKIEDDPANPERIVTLRGVGYQFSPQNTAQNAGPSGPTNTLTSSPETPSTPTQNDDGSNRGQSSNQDTPKRTDLRGRMHRALSNAMSVIQVT